MCTRCRVSTAMAAHYYLIMLSSLQNLRQISATAHPLGLGGLILFYHLLLLFYFPRSSHYSRNLEPIILDYSQ